jgi:hypothetical protein
MATTFTKIDSYTVGAGGVSSIDFTSIDSSYTDLCLKVSSRVSSTDTPVSIKFNNSTSNFSWRRIYAAGSGTPSSQSGTDTYWFYTDTAAQTSLTYGSGEVYIPNYAGSANKSFSSESLTENNGTTAEMFMVAGIWSNTAAINRITLTPLTGIFETYSTATLYGVKNA